MKARPLVLRLTAAALIVATLLVARHAVARCYRYVDALNRADVALAHTAPPPEPGHPAVSRRVVLVVVDGLADWASAHLPALGRLRAMGAHAVARSHRPSLSRPNYVSILSGVPPIHSGVRTNAYHRRVGLDSLARRAAAAGMPAAFVTDSASSVATLFNGDFAEVAYATWEGGLREATRLALGREYRLVVLLPGAVDECGHARRMSSARCDQAARDVDAYLAEVAAQLDLRRDTLIITADHGHVHSGGHGGAEESVLRIPLVMVGAGVDPGGDLGSPRLIDVASTIAALLGFPAPVHGLGTPLLGGLTLAPDLRATIAQRADERIARNLAIVDAEQAAGRRERAEARPVAMATIAAIAALLVLALALAARVRLLRLDARAALAGLALPVVAAATLFVYQDCVGSLSCFGSADEWTGRVCLAAVSVVVAAILAGYRRRVVELDERLAAGNAVHAIALAIAIGAEAALSALYEHDPFVVLPREAAMFVLVATPPTITALALGLLIWRAFDAVAVLAVGRAALPVAIGVLGACGGSRAEPVVASSPPRVVVLVVVDQLSEPAFAAKLTVATGGFAELARRGRRYVGVLPYAASATAPGHAALATGAPPSVTGIIGNEWWDRAAGREIKSVDDPAGGTSAARLRVDGIADVLTRTRPGSRGLAVALKDRSAILALGHAGEPTWYDEARGAMVGRGAPPRWLGPLAAPQAVAPRLDAVWTPAVPGSWLAAWSGGPDDGAELAIPGWSARFPHASHTLAAPSAGLPVSPAGNRLVIDAALAALADLELDDDAPDYLVVSLSAHDYIVHAFGPDSWEAWDAFVRLDHDLGELVAALDARAGRGGWAMIVTSDHGGPSSPERLHAAGRPGARITFDDVDAVAEVAAAAALGPGPWIAAARPPYLYLEGRARALPAPSRARLIDAVVAAVRRAPGLEAAWPTAALSGECATRSGDERAFCLSIDLERAGEITYSPAEGTAVIKPSSPDTVTHGSVHLYDREVPVLLVVPGVAGGGRGPQVSTLQIAPTLARLLGVPPPPAAAEAPIPFD